MTWRLAGACTCGKAWMVERSDGWVTHHYGSRETVESLIAGWMRLSAPRKDTP